MHVFDSNRAPWQTPTEEEVEYFVQQVRTVVATLLLPKPQPAWVPPRHQEALDLTPNPYNSDVYGPHFVYDHQVDHVLEHHVRLPDPYSLARVVAAEQGHTWSDASDALLFAHLNRATLGVETYDRLTGPWRVLVGPVHEMDEDPLLSDRAKDVAMMLLATGKVDVRAAMLGGRAIAVPAQT